MRDIGWTAAKRLRIGCLRQSLRKITSGALSKLAPVAQLLEVSQVEFYCEWVLQSHSGRYRHHKLVLKRDPAIRTAVASLRGTPALTDAGTLSVQALDGRHVSDAVGEGMLRPPAGSIAKFNYVVAKGVFCDESKKGARSKVPSFKPGNTTTEATTVK